MNNSQTQQERYIKEKEMYASGRYDFDVKTKADLKLGQGPYVIPQLFLSIFKNDLEELKKQNKNTYHLHAYACDEKNGLLSETQQQYLTPFMYALYLGREKCIQHMIEHGANLDQGMFVAGHCPLSILLIGRASNEVAEKIALRMLDNHHQNFIQYPFYSDSYGRSIMHYAIERNLLALVKNICDIAKNEKVDLLNMMYEQKNTALHHLDLDDCVLQNQFEILEVLLAYATKLKSFYKYEKEGWIFRKETLEKATEQQLIMLKQQLEKNATIRKSTKNTTMIERIEKVIKEKYVPPKLMGQKQNFYAQSADNSSSQMEPDPDNFRKNLIF